MALPTEAITVRFPPTTVVEETYQLLELPSEILKAVEGGEIVPLTIKGRPHDDAVLCTADKTYTLRTVDISNSLLILRPPADGPSSSKTTASQTLQIRDVCHQVLECVPCAGRVERLRGVLKDSAWTGFGAEHPGRGRGRGLGKRKRGTGTDAGDGDDDEPKRYTLQQLQSIIQASDAELAAALARVNAVEVDGHMLLLPPGHLSELIGVLLTLLTLHGDEGSNEESWESQTKAHTQTATQPEAQPQASTLPRAKDEEKGGPLRVCPSAPIFGALAEHDVDAELTSAVMRLFGSVDDDLWRVDVTRMITELGRGLLAGLKDAHTPVDTFLTSWTRAAGDEFAHLAVLPALAGEYLLDAPPPSAFAAACPLIRHFPVHALPAHVATRFTDLFLTRARWRPDDMAPFLVGLYPPGDKKAKDKLIAKYVRVVKEKDGAWWYPRRTG